jgi:DNA-binding NarL/FixJ family response regulator
MSAYSERTNVLLDETSMMVSSAPENGPVRVLVNSESAVELQRVKALLFSCHRVVVVGAVSTDAFAAIESCRPDVVVVDVGVGCMGRINLCKAIRASHPNVGIVCITGSDQAGHLRAAILAGAQGYVLKAASGIVLEQCIVAVSIGKALIDPQLTSQVLKWVCEEKTAASPDSVAGSSIEDLKTRVCSTARKTNREMARELTVEHDVIMARPPRVSTRLHRVRSVEMDARSVF